MLIEKVTTNVKRTVLLSFLVQFTNYLLEKKNDEQVETPDDPSNFTPVTVVCTLLSISDDLVLITFLLYKMANGKTSHFIAAFLILTKVINSSHI